jgi:hypothetical protein
MRRWLRSSQFIEWCLVMTILYVGNFMYIFYLLPAALAHLTNTSVRRLHYVPIYVSYNEILFWLYLFQLVQQHLYLSCERLHMARLDDCSILHPEHLVRRSTFKTSVSHNFTCSSSQAMSRATNEQLARLDLRETWVPGGNRYACNSGWWRSLNA